MDRKKMVVLLLLLAICGISSAQNSRLKIGQSFLFNVSFWDEKLIPCWGGELSFEYSPAAGLSFNMTGTAHLGLHRHTNGQNPYVEQDFLVGVQPDFRIHLQDMYNGFYLGFGGDLKLLVARNFFEPTPDDPAPTYAGIEMSLGAMCGTYYQLGNRFSLNPFFYFGIGNQHTNEYELNFRTGLNLTFDPHKDES